MRISLEPELDPSHPVLTQTRFECSQIPGPDSKAADTSITPASELPEAVPLTQAIASRGKIFTESSLPPKLPTPYPRWNPVYSEDAPHDPSSYFPMKLIR